MKKLTFKTQIRIGASFFILCLALSWITKLTWFHNIGWIVYGLLFIINPVWPAQWDYRDHKKMKIGSRLAGTIAVFVGIMTRFGV